MKCCLFYDIPINSATAKPKNILIIEMLEARSNVILMLKHMRVGIDEASLCLKK